MMTMMEFQIQWMLVRFHQWQSHKIGMEMDVRILKILTMIMMVLKIYQMTAKPEIQDGIPIQVQITIQTVVKIRLKTMTMTMMA